jgi:hypothetical protein
MVVDTLADTGEHTKGMLAWKHCYHDSNSKLFSLIIVPEEIRNKESLLGFKSALKTYLFKLAFYSR